jgi:eukaryotic-like serine/threonine-protein kinase
MPISARTEESIFAEALDKRSPDELAAFLDGACGSDAALRARVDNLLKSHEHAGSFLRKPLAATVDDPIAERPGMVIGPYKLMEQIGEGGMGLVFVAEQQQPVRRKVALKIIKPGMDSKQVIARFEAERQALAMMDHQNIAKVFDAGTTESGRPYFVMELVHGVPITDYCDANKLTPRQRLELFVPVCQAIQHAHQKGIIHRDIKPSNVLVTMYDDKPVPKVIDFGVAKAIEQRLTEKSVYTQFGTLVGTFEYMSPEQAEMNAFGVDTRSDIYALGVLLYELLTGTTPLERQRLREAAFSEIVRRIKEEEPQRPSVWLSTSGTLAKVAEARRTEPAKLSRLVRGELDWVVMRCLEKDRSRRYETANSLARDLQRYLADEPVEARPPTTWYRFRKLARRNKAALTTAALVGLALVVGTVVSTWLAVRARQAEAEARAAEFEATQERDRARDAEKRASEEKKNAQTSLGFLVNDVLGQADPLQGSDPALTVRDMLDGAARRLERDKNMPPLVEAEIRTSLGKTYEALGNVEMGLSYKKKAFELRLRTLGEHDPATVEAAIALGGSYWLLSDFANAKTYAEFVYNERRRTLGEDDPETLAARYPPGFAMSLEDFSERAASLPKGLEACRRGGEPEPITSLLRFMLGLSYAEIGRYDKGESLLVEAIANRQAAKGKESRDALIARVQRIRVLVYMKRFAEAEKEGEETCRLMNRLQPGKHFFGLTTEAGMAHIYLVQGKKTEAEPHLARIREAVKEGIPPFPPLILSMADVGRDFLKLGNFTEAEFFLQAVARHAPKLPKCWLRYSIEAAHGASLAGQKKYDKAEPLLRDAIESFRDCEDRVLQSLTPERRGVEAAKIDEALNWLVRLYEETGKPKDAAKWREIQNRRAALTRPDGSAHD